MWIQPVRRILRAWNSEKLSAPDNWQVCGAEENLGRLLYIDTITGIATDEVPGKSYVSYERGVFVGAASFAGTSKVGGRIEGYNGTEWVTIWEETVSSSNCTFWRPNLSIQVKGYYSKIRCLSYYNTSGAVISNPWIVFDIDLNF